jgi:hypothetical protein
VTMLNTETLPDAVGAPLELKQTIFNVALWAVAVFGLLVLLLYVGAPFWAFILLCVASAAIPHFLFGWRGEDNSVHTG